MTKKNIAKPLYEYCKECNLKFKFPSEKGICQDCSIRLNIIKLKKKLSLNEFTN